MQSNHKNKINTMSLALYLKTFYQKVSMRYDVHKEVRGRDQELCPKCICPPRINAMTMMDTFLCSRRKKAARTNEALEQSRASFDRFFAAAEHSNKLLPVLKTMEVLAN